MCDRVNVVMPAKVFPKVRLASLLSFIHFANSDYYSSLGWCATRRTNR